MRVRVRNPQFERRHLYFFEVPEFIEYQGTEVRPGRWENPQEVLCLTTGIADFPVRSIQRRHIVSIDGQSYSAGQAQIQTRIVKGSKGQDYVLTRAESGWRCTCPGFTFRNSCKHIAEAQ